MHLPGLSSALLYNITKKAIWQVKIENEKKREKRRK